MARSLVLHLQEQVFDFMTVEIQVNDFLIVIARGNNSIFACDKQKHFFIVISWKN